MASSSVFLAVIILVVYIDDSSAVFSLCLNLSEFNRQWIAVGRPNTTESQNPWRKPRGPAALQPCSPAKSAIRSRAPRMNRCEAESHFQCGILEFVCFHRSMKSWNDVALVLAIKQQRPKDGTFIL
jgi:hypothetical protein